MKPLLKDLVDLVEAKELNCHPDGHVVKEGKNTQLTITAPTSRQIPLAQKANKMLVVQMLLPRFLVLEVLLFFHFLQQSHAALHCFTTPRQFSTKSSSGSCKNGTSLEAPEESGTTTSLSTRYGHYQALK